MNSNDDVKKMVRTTIISFIIIALGLLIVCGVRPPQPSLEDFDSVGGSGDELTEDDDLSALLNEDDGESLEGDTSSDDDLFASEDESSEYDELSGNGSSDEMNEILSLLESDDDDSAFEDDGFDLSDDLELEDDSPVELASVSEVTGNAGGSEESDQFEGSLNDEEYDELQTEANRLTDVLSEKSAEAESLKTVLEKYDEKIAVMELEGSIVEDEYEPASTSMDYAASTSESSGSSYTSSSPASTSSVSAGYSSKKSYSKPKSSAPKRSPYEVKFQSAVKKFSTAKYRDAIDQFEYLIYLNAEDSLADNCQYYLGECFLAQRKYTKAIIEFEKVFVFDNNDKAADAQMKLGMTFMKKGDTGQAKMEFDNLLAFYSDSEFARKARSYLKQL